MMKREIPAEQRSFRRLCTFFRRIRVECLSWTRHIKRSGRFLSLVVLFGSAVYCGVFIYLALAGLQREQPADDNGPFTFLIDTASEEFPRFTEGSILEFDDGSLLYAISRFRGTTADFASAEIVGRRSNDDGRTWSKPVILQKNTGAQNVMSVTLRRMQPPGKKSFVAMYYLQKNSATDLKYMLRRSYDDGHTFGEATVITPEPGYHIVNNDRVVQLKSGRLVAPVSTTPDIRGDGHLKCVCYFSDDFGDNWTRGTGMVDVTKRGAMEPTVVELKDGRLMMLARTQLGDYAKSYSMDAGDNWSKPTWLGVKAPEAPCTLRRIPTTDDLLLIWNNKYEARPGGGGRTPLTAAISSDEVQTWKHIRDLDNRADRSFAYTSVLFRRDRCLITHWESDPSTGRLSSRFRSLPISWFYEESP
jgi:sialidase-1